MNPSELKQRTKNMTTSVIGRQLLRSATSVGANYRAVCRGKSRADFIAKLGIVEEECDESLYWLEMLVETNQIKSVLVSELFKEGEEILAIVVASAKTARMKNNPKSAIANPK